MDVFVCAAHHPIAVRSPYRGYLGQSTVTRPSSTSQFEQIRRTTSNWSECKWTRAAIIIQFHCACDANVRDSWARIQWFNIQLHIMFDAIYYNCQFFWFFVFAFVPVVCSCSQPLVPVWESAELRNCQLGSELISNRIKLQCLWDALSRSRAHTHNRC